MEPAAGGDRSTVALADGSTPESKPDEKASEGSLPHRLMARTKKQSVAMKPGLNLHMKRSFDVHRSNLSVPQSPSDFIRSPVRKLSYFSLFFLAWFQVSTALLRLKRRKLSAPIGILETNSGHCDNGEPLREQSSAALEADGTEQHKLEDDASMSHIENKKHLSSLSFDPVTAIAPTGDAEIKGIAPSSGTS